MSEKTVQRLRLTLRQVETFAAIARQGSTRLAAGSVARSQSAISTALAELESVLEVQLFDRVGRQLLLNENGRQLLPLATELIERAADLEATFDRVRLPPLRLGASYTLGEYVLPPLISQWKAQYPEGHVQLDIGNTEAVLQAVAAFDIDVGFIEGANTHPDLIVQHWFDDELAVFAAPTHPLVGRRVGVADLAEAVWFMREPGSGTREAADRLLVPALGRVSVEMVFGSNEAVKNAVASGLGLGCLSTQAVSDAFARGWLARLDVALPTMKRTLAIVSHRDKPLRPMVRDFVEQCRASKTPPKGKTGGR